MNGSGQTIYLARHGETDWNRAGRWQGHSDIELNDFGRAQARELAAALSGERLVGVGASDLARARETASIVAQSLGLGEVAVDPGLRERCFGVFEGLTYDECNERYPTEWARYRSEHRIAPPGAEHASDVAARVRAAILRLAGAGHRTLLLVSHGGAMRSFLSAVTGKLPPPLSNGATFRLTLRDGEFSDISGVR